MADDQRLNTLGLRDKELDGLFNKIDQQSAEGSGGSANRIDSRWNFRHESLAIKILQPGGSEIETRMACRNLSKGGVGLLHRSYLHTGNECVVTIPHPMKGDLFVKGKIVRCTHISGMVHEIGIIFDEEIPLREIMRPDPMQEIFAVEKVDPDTLMGSILLVEDSDMDVQLVKHFLRTTQLRIKHATNIAEAEKLVRSGVGLLLCDIHLGEENGGDFVKKLHETPGWSPPVVMVSADRADTTYSLITHPGVKGFLAKPFSQDSLIRTIGEFMVDPPAEGAGGEAGGVQADAQIVAALLPELVKTCGKLEEAVKGADATLVLSLLMQLAGVAPVLGLGELAGILESMCQQMAGTMDLTKVTAKIDDIVRMCQEAADR